MSTGKIKRVAAQPAGGNRAAATARPAVEVTALRRPAADASGRGRISRRSLDVKRWDAQARLAALRERSRRIDRMCLREAARQGHDTPVCAATGGSDEALVRTLGQDVQPVDSAQAANAVGLLFSEANALELAFLMRLIAEGDTATASRIARRIVEEKTTVAAVARDQPAVVAMPRPLQAAVQPLTSLPAPEHAPAGTKRAHAGPPAGAGREGSALSPRELNVLRLISQGLSNREIAETSYRSLHTVDAQVKNIYRKLAVKSRAQAVRDAMQKGLINLDG